MRCPLCEGTDLAPIIHAPDPKTYLHCRTCDLRFLDPTQRLAATDERARYDLHQYDERDAGYANFTAPLVACLEGRVKPGARGLDFGAGRIPVLARCLERRGFAVDLYDAYYWPDVGALTRRYDFVVSCEVIEHFFEPAAEFARLREILAPSAPLIVMTERWSERGSFHDWSYRRDPTHVSFYSTRTFHWIAERFGFNTVHIEGRVVCLTAPERN